MSDSANAGIFTNDPVEGQKTMSTEDAFDAYKNSLTSGLDKSKQEQPAQTDETTDENTETQTTENDGGQEDNNQENTVPEFKPIKFSGEALGEKIDIEIKSERELNAYLKRGHMAQSLYNDLQKLQTEIAPIQERAALMDIFDEKVKNEPLSVVKTILTEHMSREEYLQFISDEYAYHHKLANMSPEERAREEAIINGQRAAAELARIEKEKASLIERQKQQENEAWTLNKSQWANDELRAWKQKLPPNLENLVKTTLISFADKADAMRAKGQRVDMKKLSSELKSILQPLVNSASLERNKNGKNAQSRSRDATSVVQNSARNAMRNVSNSQSNAPSRMDSADIWDAARSRAAAGQLTLKP